MKFLEHCGLMSLKLLERWLNALQVEIPPMRIRRLNALEGRQWLVTGGSWPITGQKVRELTKCENTYKKIFVLMHHNENYMLVTILHQRSP